MGSRPSRCGVRLVVVIERHPGKRRQRLDAEASEFIG
jgi:hypothetical protein